MNHTTTKMQQVISALATKHGLSFTTWGGVLRLSLPGYMPLVIESLIPGTVVTVTHYYRQNGDLCPDPDMEFGTTAEGWVPLCKQDSLSYTRPEPGSNGQAALAAFADFWACNLEAQGWLERAVRVEALDGDDGAAGVAVAVEA